ncbi:MAG: porin family protein [Prevotella sp.]|nr:porin family protein [Prevotella sp.]
MRDRKEYNEQLDDFSRLVKQKLEGHRIPVDADSWTEIEQRLKPQKRQRLWWIAGAAAAVAVLVSVFLFRPQDDFDGQPVTIGQILSVDQMPSTSTEEKHQQAEEPDRPVVPAGKKLPAGSVGLMAKQAESVTTSHGVKTVADIEKTLSTDSAAQDIEKKLSEFIADAGSVVKASDSVPAKLDVKSKNEPEIWLAAKKNKKEKNWLLAAAFSSNGGASNTMDKRMYGDHTGELKSEFVNDASLFAAKDPYTMGNAQHSLPLSFGLSVRKNLSDRIGLETGLVYTYLSSRFNSASPGGIAQEAKQELHYLGIPLNAVVYLWDNSKWSVYLSAGVMGEKGLKRNYTYTNAKRNTNGAVKERIDGLQWSLNASLGISYRLYQDWGVYVEPRYSYFFDNNQPVSIRTDKQSVFGFNAGLRFEF